MSHGDELGVGDLLDDKYIIEGLIGRGGMGAVYRARHVRLDSPRAIKIMRPEIAQDDAFIRRFRNEALLAEGVRHPNVVALYDFSTLPDGTSYIVWEYVEGATVGQVLSRGIVFTDAEVADLVGDAADGLATAHRQGILHRDVSPDNIMICADAQGKRTAKLLDFGVAKGGGIPAETPTDADMCFGKIGYASPEQMGLLKNHEQLDERTDVFSLAAVTFAMLVGESPFDTSSMQRFIHELMIAPEAEVQGRYLERLAEPWRKPLSRALARNREARTPTVEEFIVGVKQAVEPAPSERIHKSEPGARRGRYASAAAAVVAAAVVFAVVSTVLREPSPPEISRDEASELVVEAMGTESGTEPVSPLREKGEESSPSGDSPVVAGRSEDAVEPATDEGQEGDPRAWQGQGSLRRTERLASDEQEPRVEEPLQENGVPGGIREGEGNSSPPDGEADTQVIEPPEGRLVPKPVAAPPVPVAEPKGSDGEGTKPDEAEREAPQETQSVPPEPLKPRRIVYVEPVYPPMASRLEIEGEVLLKGVINEQGDVIELSVVRSIPYLDQAALDAVRQWKYEPTLVDGVAVPVEFIFTVRFKQTP